MDDLGALILGKPPETKSASVITDQLLDNLRRVESGGDRFALNKQSKAMGAYQFLPEQVITMHKKGIEFNPFNEAESRQAAKNYLEQLVKEKGSVEKALATYGGFITKDPTEYVNKVLKAPASKANAPASLSAPVQKTTQTAPIDELGALILGKPVTSAQPIQPTSAQPISAEPSQPSAESTTGTQEGTMGNYVPRRQPVGKVRQIIGNVLKKGFETRQELGERAAGAVDTV
jgi:hypothetical protein